MIQQNAEVVRGMKIWLAKFPHGFLQKRYIFPTDCLQHQVGSVSTLRMEAVHFSETTEHLVTAQCRNDRHLNADRRENLKFCICNQVVIFRAPFSLY
jgi:hypothetical protein